MCYNGGMNVEDLVAAARELKMPLVTLRQLALSLTGAGVDDVRIQAEMVGVSERALRQVNDLMRLERLPSGLYGMEPVAVRAVCAEAMQLVADCEVEIQCRNRIPLVVANRELLGSVVYNMLDNAANAARDSVRLSLRDTRDGVEIAVRDRGPVLPAMRPGGLSIMLVTQFSQYMHAEVGTVRHRDGMSYLVWLPRSQQRSLFA